MAGENLKPKLAWCRIKTKSAFKQDRLFKPFRLKHCIWDTRCFRRKWCQKETNHQHSRECFSNRHGCSMPFEVAECGWPLVLSGSCSPNLLNESLPQSCSDHAQMDMNNWHCHCHHLQRYIYIVICFAYMTCRHHSPKPGVPESYWASARCLLESPSCFGSVGKASAACLNHSANNIIYVIYKYIYMRVVLNSFIWKTSSSPNKNSFRRTFANSMFFFRGTCWPRFLRKTWMCDILNSSRRLIPRHTSFCGSCT